MPNQHKLLVAEMTEQNKRYISNTVLPSSQYENQYINRDQKNGMPINSNNQQIHNIIEEEGRMGEYEMEEENIVCARFPH